MSNDIARLMIQLRELKNFASFHGYDEAVLFLGDQLDAVLPEKIKIGLDTDD